MKPFEVFAILVYVFHYVSGVEVFEGVESVLLPCQISRVPEDPIVVWSRPDLNPTTLHQHQEKADKAYVQNQHYRSRTAMPVDALDSGNLSLTLYKPRLCDSGIYTCSIRSGGFEMKQTDVELQVKEPYTFPAEAWVLLVLLAVVLIVVLGLAVHLWHNTIRVSQLVVKEEESVVLPYKTIVKLPQDATVLWSRSDPKPMKVHAYQRNSESHQDEFYSGRTEMKTNPLKLGDLSLTLKNACYRDSGTYICTVHVDNKILAQKVVRLLVQAVLEVEEWKKSVTLRFKTKAQLSDDVTVVWKRLEPEPMVAHVLDKGKDPLETQDEYYKGRTKMDENAVQSKNLSLTLLSPGLSDRGTYICTVSKNGETLMQKKVLFSVKVSKGSKKKESKNQPEIVKGSAREGLISGSDSTLQ